jgi:hypothetical protein
MQEGGSARPVYHSKPSFNIQNERKLVSKPRLGVSAVGSREALMALSRRVGLHKTEAENPIASLARLF